MLARYYRVALKRTLPARDEQLIRINLACALNGLSEHAQALEELDRVSLQQLSSLEVALWLNNRAYTLVFLGQSADALDNLKDADELLAGDEGGGRDPLLTACISGTRGIALYHQGDYERAESALQLALSLEDDGVHSQFELAAEVDPARTAERWWWLSQVAQARGEAEQILQEGRADLIALARELLYNPNWPMDAAQKLGVDRQFGSVPPPQAIAALSSPWRRRCSIFGPCIVTQPASAAALSSAEGALNWRVVSNAKSTFFLLCGPQ